MTTKSPAVCRDAPDFDREAFHRTFNLAITEFFKRHLPGSARRPS